MPYDVVVVGGGPTGLSAALALGRARKRVLLSDGGPRRNAAAVHIHNFVTRDGTPPGEFRRIGREQLATYPNVEARDARIDAVAGSKGAFRVEIAGETVEARRILLCAGMVDEMVPLEGFRALWGHAIFQCPYCHGWEVQDRAWGYLALPHMAAHALPFAMQMRAWSRDVVVFSAAGMTLPEEVQAQLRGAGVRVETAAVTRLVADGQQLRAVELDDGRSVERDVLFAHPKQRQVELVRALGLALDDDGFIQIDPMRRETSVPGVYAAGDAASRMQAAIAGAASGMQAAAFINLELTMELVAAGSI